MTILTDTCNESVLYASAVASGLLQLFPATSTTPGSAPTTPTTTSATAQITAAPTYDPHWHELSSQLPNTTPPTTTTPTTSPATKHKAQFSISSFAPDLEMHPSELFRFRDAADWCDAVIAIERPGPNKYGEYMTMRGRPMTHLIAPLEDIIAYKMGVSGHALELFSHDCGDIDLSEAMLPMSDDDNVALKSGGSRSLGQSFSATSAVVAEPDLDDDSGYMLEALHSLNSSKSTVFVGIDDLPAEGEHTPSPDREEHDRISGSYQAVSLTMSTYSIEGATYLTPPPTPTHYPTHTSSTRLSEDTVSPPEPSLLHKSQSSSHSRSNSRSRPVRAPFLSIGIGDGGNEVGMGKIYNELLLESSIPNVKDIACIVPTTYNIASSVSNWGGYALACAITIYSIYLTLQHDHHHQSVQQGQSEGEENVAAVGDSEDNNRQILTHISDIEALIEQWVVSEEQESELFRVMVAGGARDGITHANALTVDGLPWSESIQVLTHLKAILSESLTMSSEGS